MVTAGLGLGLRDIVGPLRRPRLVIAALGLNFVLAPAIAYALAKMFGLDRPYATGLLILSAAAGAPFLPKLAQLAKGDVAFSVGLMLLLTVGTVVFLPILLPLLIPGQSADPWPILRPLLFTMLVPLAVGMVIRGRSEQWSARLRPAFALLSNLSMVVAIAVLVVLHFQAMIGTFGSGRRFRSSIVPVAAFGVRLCPRRAGAWHAIRAGTRHRSAKHCRGIDRRHAELGRPQGRRHAYRFHAGRPDCPGACRALVRATIKRDQR